MPVEGKLFTDFKLEFIALARERPRPPLTRADFPVSGENVRKADKRGAGRQGCQPNRLTGGRENRWFSTTPQSKTGCEVPVFASSPDKGSLGCGARRNDKLKFEATEPKGSL